MAHSSIKPIWKYSWKPEGYGMESLTYDASKNKIGDIVKLEHSYFRGKEFSVSAGSKNLTVGYENQTLTGKEDIVLRLYDSKLSQLGDSSIFRAFELTSKRAIASLSIQVNFIADAIDPAEFGQNLNQVADVSHNSLRAAEYVAAPYILVDEADIDRLSGSWGELTKDKITFIPSSFSFGNLNMEGGKLIINEPLTLESQGDMQPGLIRYNQETFLWEIWNVRSQSFVPIILSHVPADKIPVGSIPVVSGDDPAAQSYVPWLTIDPATKTLKVPEIESKSFISSDGVVSVLKEVQIGDHSLRVDDNGILDIDGILQIDKKNQIVKICGLTIDATLINKLKKDRA